MHMYYRNMQLGPLVHKFILELNKKQKRETKNFHKSLFL